MATSEIEKLERRYAENPQGLTFAPLAEVHRKNGDVARALELLKAGLELHPNYIPASIVLGRCHWDSGDLPAAEAAFAHVLRLDDENVIALKSLADINERLERLGEAQRWLNRLVSVDRSNEEARQQLNRLQAAKDKADRPAETTAAPAAKRELPREIAAVQPTVAPEKRAAAAAPQSSTGDEIAPLDLTASIAEPASRSKADEILRQEAAPKSAELEFLDTSEPLPKPADTARSAEPEKSVPPEEPAPVSGLISQEFEPPKETYRVHPELTQEFVAGKEIPDGLDVETTPDVELQSSGATEFRVPNAAEDFMELAARLSGAHESKPPVDPPTPPKPPTPPRLDLVAPGTMAQGKSPSYSARDTSGQSVASFFEAMLASRPPGDSASSLPPSSPASPGGAPARPAQDPLSLSSVFGEETGSSSPASPAAGQTKDGPVSYDDFFGSPAGGPGPLPQGSSDPSKDDLDQFQSWLQNLKR